MSEQASADILISLRVPAATFRWLRRHAYRQSCSINALIVRLLDNVDAEVLTEGEVHHASTDG